MNNEEQSKNQIKKHNIILENRKTLNVSGVKDVSEFDDGKVIITTNNGLLTVDGEGLHINSFSQQTGDLDLEVSSGDVEMDKCDADNMSISASSGTIEGTVLSKFDYEISVSSGDTKVPDNGNDGTCKITVGSGDVRIELAK